MHKNYFDKFIDKEKCYIVEDAFSGIHKIMNNRCSCLKNKYSVKEK